MVDHGSMGSTNYACETSVNNVFYGGGYNLDRLSGDAPSRPDGQNNEHECAIPTYAVTGPPNRKCRIVARSNGSIESTGGQRYLSIPSGLDMAWSGHAITMR
jgi:hypothetical protein